MNDHPEAPKPRSIDTDRLAVSSELLNLASEFAIESTLWRETDAVRNLERSARHLGQIGRQVLTTGQVDVATAFADAGRLTLRQVQNARRFLTTLEAAPLVRVRDNVVRWRCEECGMTWAAVDAHDAAAQRQAHYDLQGCRRAG